MVHDKVHDLRTAEQMLQFVINNWDHYKDAYRAWISTDNAKELPLFLPTTSGTLCRPQECFTKQGIPLISLETLRSEPLPKGLVLSRYASWLGVREEPDPAGAIQVQLVYYRILLAPSRCS